MWSVLHWIFLYCLNPNPCMHIISSFALSIMSAKTDDDFKKKDIVPAISLFFMYCAKALVLLRASVLSHIIL